MINIFFFLGALFLLIVVVGMVALFYYRMYESLNKVASEEEERARNTNTTQERLEKKFNARTDTNEKLLQDVEKKHMQLLDTHDDKINENKEAITQNRNTLKKNKEETEASIRDMGEKLGSEISILDEDMNNVFEELDEFGNEFQDYRQFQEETTKELEGLRDKDVRIQDEMVKKLNTNYRFSDDDKNQLEVTHPALSKDDQALKVSNLLLDNNLSLSPTSMLRFGSAHGMAFDKNGTLSIFKVNSDGRRGEPVHRFDASGVAKHKKGVETNYIKIGNYTFKEKGDRLFIVDPYNETEYDLISRIMESPSGQTFLDANDNDNNWDI